MRRPLTIDGSRRAIVPRVNQGSYTIEDPTPTTIPPHTHSADQITAEPLGLLAGDDAQEQLYELDTEKLARSGVQTMLGALDMNHNSVNNADDLDVEGTATVAENVTLTGGVGAAIVSGVRNIVMAGIGLIEQVRKLDFTGSTTGQAIIDQPRKIHMAGDHLDGEALIDGVEWITANNEPTASVLDGFSRLDMNTGVAVGSDWSLADGRVGHDSAEHALVGVVSSGTSDVGGGVYSETFVPVALGWTVYRCISSELMP
jgi:hypothetical protein